MHHFFRSLAVLLLTATLTHAATSQTTPSDDLLGAIRQLGPGDTLLLASGTYTPGMLTGLPGGTSWTSPITIKAAPGASVRLMAPPQNGAWLLFLQQPSEQYLVFDNLIFDGNNRQGNTVAITGNPGPVGAHHIRFVTCEFTNAEGEVSLSHTHHNEFIGGSIHDNNDTSGLRHGIYLSSEASDNLIDGMQIYNKSSCQITRKGPYIHACTLEWRTTLHRCCVWATLRSLTVDYIGIGRMGWLFMVESRVAKDNTSYRHRGVRWTNSTRRTQS